MKTYYSIEYAARKWGEYGLDEEEINRLVEEGIVEAVRVETEDRDIVVVSGDDIRSVAADRVDRAKFAHLTGVEISAGRASRKYNFALSSLLKWAAQGHIKVLRREGQMVYLDEGDVAYARERANVKNLRQGQRLF